MLLAKLAAEHLAEGAAQQTVVLPYSNNDIADMLGVSRNSVTSVISRLQAQGVIEKQRSAIRIIDAQRLAEIAQLEQE